MSRSFPDFVPHPLLPSGHLQTIAGVYMGAPPAENEAIRRTVKLDDGDLVVLHDDCPDGWQSDGRIALLLHGLTGSHRSPYLARLARKLQARGVRTFRMDLRGCGAGFRLARHFGHAGRSEDVGAAIDAVLHWCPRATLSVVGYSMGGNLMLKLLGELGDDAPPALVEAVAVSPPIDLHACIRQLESGVNWLYCRSFVSRLLRDLRRRRDIGPLRRLPLAPRPLGLSDFDSRFTAPLGGFNNVDDYYTQSSPAPLLRRIGVRTLIVASADDPMVPADIYDRTPLSPTIELHITRRGGHVGFISSRHAIPDGWWIDGRVTSWLALP